MSESKAGLVKQIETKRGRLVELFTGGVFTLDEIKEQKAAYDLQIAKLKERRAELEVQLQQTLTDTQKLEIEEFAAKIRKGLDKADSKFKVRRRIIELLKVRAAFEVNDKGQKIIDVTCILHAESQPLALAKQTKQNKAVALDFAATMLYSAYICLI